MSRFRGITRLTVEGFRGATSRIELDFVPERPFVVLFGENGSGKSTLIDAIEFALHGTKGSLDDLKSTRPKDLATIGTAARPLHADVETEDGAWSASLAGAKAALWGHEPRPKVEILRRSRLAKVVAAGPTDRYEQLDRFIDVAGVARSEEGLATALREAKKRLQGLSEEIAGAEQEIQELWEEAGRPGRDLLGWAKRETARTGSDPARVQGWLAAVLGKLAELASAWNRCLLERARLGEAEAALRSLESDTGEGARVPISEPLIRFLESAERLLAKGAATESCPLCAQGIDHADLHESVRSRLEGFRTESESLRKRAAARIQVEAAQRALDSARDDLRKAASRLDRTSTAPPPEVPELAAGFERLFEELARIASEPDPPALRDLLAELTNQLEAANRRLLEEGGQATTVARHLKRVEDGRGRAEAIEEEVERFEQCLQVVRDARRAFVDDVLQNVAVEVNRLFSELHPNEDDAGAAQFYLDPKQRAALHQLVDFGSATDVAPQACFSESHLLTLALCLWLALAKRDAPAETILVLDDALFAIDTPHLRRVATLLASESEHFAQVLLATQSRRLARFLRDGLAPTNRLDYRALRWSLAGGILHGSIPHLTEELEQVLASTFFDRQAASAKAGVLLEATLRQLALLYRRRVPYGEPTEPGLGELISSWSLGEAGKVLVERRAGESFSPDRSLRDVLEPLHGLTAVRNHVGAHLNTQADDVPDAEVRAFVEAVLNLWNLVVCSSCGQIPNRAQESVFLCQCQQTRLRPDRLA